MPTFSTLEEQSCGDLIDNSLVGNFSLPSLSTSHKLETLRNSDGKFFLSGFFMSKNEKSVLEKQIHDTFHKAFFDLLEESLKNWDGKDPIRPAPF